MNKEEFSNKISQDVSRETFDNLLIYAELLIKWQKKINLVSPKTINNLWDRHIIDSAQIFKHVNNGGGNILDFGSGAGFPSLVLSIMGINNVNLVESDSRKCSFMREIVRKTGCSANILNERIENIEMNNVSFVTARALSSLDKLLSYSYPFVNEKTTCLFLKGQNVKDEIAETTDKWAFSLDKVESITDTNAIILKISDIKKL